MYYANSHPARMVYRFSHEPKYFLWTRHARAKAASNKFPSTNNHANMVVSGWKFVSFVTLLRGVKFMAPVSLRFRIFGLVQSWRFDNGQICPIRGPVVKELTGSWRFNMNSMKQLLIYQNINYPVSIFDIHSAVFWYLLLHIDAVGVVLDSDV